MFYLIYIFRTAKKLLTEGHYSNINESFDLRRRDRTIREETPTIFKSPPKVITSSHEEYVFQSNIAPEEIASRILVGLPHLPLRNNDSTTYSEAITDILETAMIKWFDSPEAEDNVSIGLTRQLKFADAERMIDELKNECLLQSMLF